MTPISESLGNEPSLTDVDREEVLVGSVVVIAGVAFIAVSAGAGALVLVPTVLMASASSSDEPVTAQVSP